MTWLGYLDYQKGRKIIANYELGYDYTYMKLEDVVKLPPELQNATVLLDEIQEGADARTFFKKSNMALSTLAKQLRKRNIVLYFTTQRFKEVDIRLREQTDIIVFTRPLGKGFFYVEVYEYKGGQEKLAHFQFDGRQVFQYYDTEEIITYSEEDA